MLCLRLHLIIHAPVGFFEDFKKESAQEVPNELLFEFSFGKLPDERLKIFFFDKCFHNHSRHV
jgi:hypothetical protein